MILSSSATAQCLRDVQHFWKPFNLHLWERNIFPGGGTPLEKCYFLNNSSWLVPTACLASRNGGVVAWWLTLQPEGSLGRFKGSFGSLFLQFLKQRKQVLFKKLLIQGLRQEISGRNGRASSKLTGTNIEACLFKHPFYKGSQSKGIKERAQHVHQRKTKHFIAKH